MYPKDERNGLVRLLSESTALLEIMSGLVLRPKLQALTPDGDGHPVMLLPGFTATDRAMGHLRRFLDRVGYAAHGWGQGRNLGVRGDCLAALGERVTELADRYQQKVSLVGWSGGGMYARALAHENQGRVRQVITMGTPFKLSEDTLQYLPEGIYKLHERLSPEGERQDDMLDYRTWANVPPVPSSSLFSRRDALAPWPFCLDVRNGQSENIQVPGSHAGMTYNPLMYYVLADRLAQPEGDWQPFHFDRLRGVFFQGDCASRFELN